jgi:D(-)-tartrate dehydratase
VRIVDIRERAVGISRYRDPHVSSGGLTTSLVAVVTDVVRRGRPVAGYGFASVGRYARGGLIRERFAPRLLRAPAQDLTTDDGANLDPFRAWTVMMTGEKPGGHGERCVAVGALDMALWDAAAKIAGMPLHRFLAGRLGRDVSASQVAVYASGGYAYPDNDITELSEEIRHFAGLGFTHAKIKIGGAFLDHDLRRIEAAATHLAGTGHLAVDAMNAYDPGTSLTAATALAMTSAATGRLGTPSRAAWGPCCPVTGAAATCMASGGIGPRAATLALTSPAHVPVKMSWRMGLGLIRRW